jgi:hypothetical protein
MNVRRDIGTRPNGRRGRQVCKLLVHVVVYLAVILALFAVDSLTGGEHWFIWIAAVWGVEVLAHAVSVFAERITPALPRLGRRNQEPTS